MKRLHILCLLCVIALLGASAFDAQARKYYNHTPKPQKTDPAKTNTVAATPPVKEQMTFKDVPLNGVFYFSADTDKHFPRIKLSDTTAKNQKDGTIGNISPRTQVLGEKTKGKDAKKKADKVAQDKPVQ